MEPDKKTCTLCIDDTKYIMLCNEHCTKNSYKGGGSIEKSHHLTLVGDEEEPRGVSIELGSRAIRLSGD